MDFKVGDILFGGTIVEITDSTVVIEVPLPDASERPRVSFDRNQFNEGLRIVLQAAGVWVPQV